MTTMIADSQVLSDAGPCRVCDCNQWGHKRGKGGCTQCGTCDKYEPPKRRPVAPEQAPVPAQLVNPDQRNAQTRADLERAQARIEVVEQQRDVATAEANRLRRERDGFEVQRDQAYEAVDELNADLATLRGEHARAQADLTRVRAELDGVRQRLPGPTLSSYEAWHCDACGSRYREAWQHECGPLVPVRVTVAVRSAADR